MYAIKAKRAPHCGEPRWPRQTSTPIEVINPIQPSQLWWLEILAQSFADSKGYCSAAAQRVLLKQNLSPALERVAAGICLDRQIWLAWTSGQTIRFMVAEMAYARRSTGRNMAIHLFFYDVDGHLQASGIWVLQAGGYWDLCSVDAGNTET